MKPVQYNEYSISTVDTYQYFRYFADDIFKWISLNKVRFILIQIPLMFICEGSNWQYASASNGLLMLWQQAKLYGIFRV